nr:hypothetical protein [Streptomyces sp. NBC_01362]
MRRSAGWSAEQASRSGTGTVSKDPRPACSAGSTRTPACCSTSPARLAARSSLVQAGLTVHRAALATPPPAWAEVRAALVRPDGHIAWAAKSTDDTALTAAANTALAITHRT